MNKEVKFLSGLIILTTAPIADAQKISRALVKEKLAACVSIINNVESVYFWEGKMTHEKETLLIIKTTQRLFGDVKDWIKKHHPYNVPEVLSLKTDSGDSDYLKWINENTR